MRPLLLLLLCPVLLCGCQVLKTVLGMDPPAPTAETTVIITTPEGLRAYQESKQTYPQP